MNRLDKKKIEELLPHREPMLLIDEIYEQIILNIFNASVANW